MKSTTNRRDFLRGSLAAGSGVAGAASGIFSPTVIAQEPASIRVTHFGGPFQAIEEIVGKPFQAAGAGKVGYEVETSVSAISKLQAQQGSPPFNVVQFSRGFAIRAGKAGLLEPLVPGDIENFAELGQGALTPGGFGCMMMLDCVNIIYNGTKISRPIQSWLDLWRPELKESIVIPSASVPIHYVLMQTARSMGGNPTSLADIDAAFKKLRELKPNVRAFYGDPVQASQMIERGEIAIAVQFGIRSSNIMRKNRDIHRAIPDKEGAPAIPYDLCVTKNSANQATAKAYMNVALRRDIQAALTKELLGTPAHMAVAAESKGIVVDLDKLWFPDEDFASEHSREWGRRWTREIQA